jgi:hypothetical protein
MFLESLRHHCEVEGLSLDESFDGELRRMSNVLEIAYKNKGEDEGFSPNVPHSSSQSLSLGMQKPMVRRLGEDQLDSICCLKVN